MNSRAHLALSLAVGVAAVALTDPPVPWPAVVALAVVAGVFVDLDHFLIARYNGGDWAAVRRCLRRPAIVLVAQEEIFERGEIDAHERLLSHLLIGGVAVPALWVRAPYLAAVTAASLYVHVLADVVATTRSTVVFDAEQYAAGTHEETSD